jgi:hypothetical protein
MCDWLVLVLTPAAVQSAWVRMEVNAALTMAQDHGARMHQPILFLTQPCTPSAIPPLWRTLHFHDATNEFSVAFAKLLRTLGLTSTPATSSSSLAVEPSDLPSGAQNIAASATRTVDATGGADHASIAEAIRASSPGERILVFPGQYIGVPHIDRPLEIIGVGPADQIVIEGTRADLINVQAGWSRIANLTVRQLGRGNLSAAFGLHSGSLQLDDCDVSSGNFGLCLYTHAALFMSGCRVHDCSGNGVYLSRRAEATLEQNVIANNSGDAIVIWEGSSTSLRRNHITGNGGAAIKMSARSICRAEDNDLSGNTRPWDVPSGAWDRVHRVRNLEG